MHVLITGATGLLGSRIAQHLDSKSIVLRLATRDTVPYQLPHAETYKIDWKSQESVDSACKGIQVVIHAAGMNAQDCSLDPPAAFLANGVGTSRLQLAASRSGVRRIIYFSTAHVYCSPLIGELSENSYPANPHPYATSHLAGEWALNSPQNLLGPEVFILRMSNAVGAPFHPTANCWNLLANDLCSQAIKKRSLSLNTSGWQPCDFIPLAYVCDVIEKLLYSPSLQTPYNIFNLGGSSFSVRDFAKQIQTQASQFLSQTLPLNIPDGNPSTQASELIYCCDKLRQYLDLTIPEYEFEINHLLQFCLLYHSGRL